MSQPSAPSTRAEELVVGVGSTTTSRPAALRLASIRAISFLLASLAASLTAMCSGGTDLPSSNFFAASGSPPGFSPRSGAT